MAVNPYVAAAAGIVAMALAFEHLYREVSKINKIGGLAARVLGFVFGGAAGRLGSMLKISDAIYGAILPGSDGPSGSSGLGGDLMRELKGIPAMAAGGIVTGPTFALIGEAGPEAVIPLDRMGSMGGGITVHVNAGLVSSPDQVGQQIIEAIQKAQRRSGPVFAPA
jgi:hypothetical protein